MFRHVLILVAHDLAVAFKNKTLILLICIPLFVYATLLLVDSSGDEATPVRLGVLATEPIDVVLRGHMASAPAAFSIQAVADREAGVRLLKARLIDGLVVPDEEDPARVAVIVLNKGAGTLAIVQRMAALQIAVEGERASWLSALHSLQSEALAVQSMPTWILMVVLLVAFIVIPAQVAEEKESQTLLGLLQTPMREGEWLAAKLLYGMILMCAAVLALLLLGKSLAVTWSFWVTLLAGSFVFGAIGIALGFLCRYQASARTLGVIVYLPLLLPAALSDQSQSFRLIAPFLPSYAFFGPIQSILLDSDSAHVFPGEWLMLVFMGAVACLGAHHLMKRRWLM